MCLSRWFSVITEQYDDDDKNNIKVATSLHFTIKVLQVNSLFIITNILLQKYKQDALNRLAGEQNKT